MERDTQLVQKVLCAWSSSLSVPTAFFVQVLRNNPIFLSSSVCAPNWSSSNICLNSPELQSAPDWAGTWITPLSNQPAVNLKKALAFRPVV